ncbi:hypothetical protein FEM08_22820 [Flavobacterium gilvum]|nr:hypothetical protein FEM08_22820 [Flavobacterium gilvum]
MGNDYFTTKKIKNTKYEKYNFSDPFLYNWSNRTVTKLCSIN